MSHSVMARLARSLRQLRSSRTAVVASLLVFMVLAGSLSLTVIGHREVALLVVVAATLVMVLGVLVAQQRVLAEQATALRRAEVKLMVLEKLVSRAEWRAGQAHEEVVAELRRRSYDRPVDQGGARNRADDRLHPVGRVRFSERDLERFLVQLLVRRDEEG